jgi:RNA 2',3'-cyclic 3'-phosphodiesterase
MAKPSANLRLFVAAYPPAESAIAVAMINALQPLALPPHRPTPVEQVHLTVQFIGDTPSKNLDATIESVQRAASGLSAFQLTPRMLLTLPERGPARLVALETDLPAPLLELHRRLVTRLARSARDRHADRFRPHFTLCRFQSPVPGLRIEQAADISPFAIDRIVLMRSALSATGAQHHQVIACELE